jgi:[acyl-carrier-protein] S-malonyltransferase
MSDDVFVFPGQGAQAVGMARDLLDHSAIARELFAQASAILGFDLAKLCREGPVDELLRTENAQPALLVHGVAAYQRYREAGGAAPAFMAGHSLGEYTALTCAGAIRFADAVRVVRERGVVMAAARRGAMVAVIGKPAGPIEEACREASQAGAQVVVANYNSEMATVISGDGDAVKQVVERLERSGAVSKALRTDGAFHSPLMRDAAATLSEVLAGVDLREPEVPVISNVTALPFERGSMRELLVSQMTHPVLWTRVMAYLVEHGVTRVVELGPGKTLGRLFKTAHAKLQCLSSETGVLEPARSALRK